VTENISSLSRTHPVNIIKNGSATEACVESIKIDVTVGDLLELLVGRLPMDAIVSPVES
jgi:hypothetical protein